MIYINKFYKTEKKGKSVQKDDLGTLIILKIRIWVGPDFGINGREN